MGALDVVLLRGICAAHTEQCVLPMLREVQQSHAKLQDRLQSLEALVAFTTVCCASLSFCLPLLSSFRSAAALLPLTSLWPPFFANVPVRPPVVRLGIDRIRLYFYQTGAKFAPASTKINPDLQFHHTIWQNWPGIELDQMSPQFRQIRSDFGQPWPVYGQIRATR